LSRLAPWQAEEALVAACNAAEVFARVQLTADGKRSSIRLAMEQGMQTKRKPKGGAPDAAKISMPDENCIARLAIHGHMTLNTQVKELHKHYAEQIWRLRVQLNNYEGKETGRHTKKTFQRPSNKQTKSANRRSRRTMQAAEPFLRALWDMTDVGDSHEGLENLIMALLARGMPGSGARKAQRWTGKRMARLIWESGLFRAEFEKLRKCAVAPATCSLVQPHAALQPLVRTCREGGGGVDV
jgi:hypothetical protein